MKGIRRAFVWASVGQYVVVPINLVSTVIIARLIDPSEFGISVMGTAIFGIAAAVRELGSGAYLIQKRDLDQETIRTTMTVSLIVTLIVTVVLALLAQPLAGYFRTPGLEQYLHVAAVGYSLGPFVYPHFALMSRELAFARLALIMSMSALLSAIVGIFLAAIGFSYMSLAWAAVSSAIVGTGLCFHFNGDLSVYRPTLREWRSVIRFGAYSSMTAICYRVGESLPYLILGRFLNAEAVGLGQRAVLLSLFPERVILAGVGSVVLPAFSKQAGSGQSLKEIYLRSIELITAVQWPALIMLALLAHPIVSALLGWRWLEAVPLVQILSGALLFSFPVLLQYPALVALGAIHCMPPLIVAQSIVTLTVISLVGPYGLQAAALSMFLVLPLNGLLSVLLVRRYVEFRWGEFASALRKSAFSSAVAAAGPVTMVIGSGWRTDLSFGAAAFATILSGLGWIAGLWLSCHPLLQEMFRARNALLKMPIVMKALSYCERLP